MGYVLLWLESLTVALLFVATALAVAARFGSRWRRAIVWWICAILPLSAYAGMTFLAGMLRSQHMASGWFVPFLALTVLFVVGVLILRGYGLSPSVEESSVVRAARWPRGKLVAALLVVFGLHLISLWNVDLAIQQRIASLRTEAGALALSVAPARLPDRENAALVYAQAFESMGDKDSWPEAWEKWTSPDKPSGQEVDVDDAELVQFLQRQATTVVLLLEAADKPGCHFERDYGRPSIDMLLTELVQLRDTARLLALDARFQADNGQLDESFERIDAMFAMAEHAGSDPILISMLVAIAIDRLALETLQTVVAEHTITMSALDKLDLHSRLSYRRLFERALRMEEAFGASIFCDVAVGELNFADVEDSGSASMTWLAPLYRLFLLPRDLATYREYIQSHRRLAPKPFHEVKQESEESDSQFDHNTGGPLTVQLLPPLGRATRVAAQGDARRRLTEMAIAVLRYQVQQNKFPETMDQLVPKSLLFLATDPFDGQPLRMIHDDNDLVLYSVGPDMVDDKGTPEKQPGSSDSEDAHTDIVFRLRG